MSKKKRSPTQLSPQERALERLHELERKFGQLVWYARSNPPGDPFWDTVPAQIKEGALNCQAKVEEQFTDEIDKLKCPECGDWSHGFNSGMLAAARLLLTYLHPQDDAAEQEQLIEDAEKEFPELWT